MKRSGILHGRLNQIIAEMGHGDLLCVGDAGLPVPPGVERIDLAVTKGVPGFLVVLETIVEDLAVEAYILAHETKDVSPAVAQEIARLLPEADVIMTDHEGLKQDSRRCVAVVRTGEATPYANVILRAGVTFG